MKRVLKGLGLLIVVLLVAGGAFVGIQISSFNSSMKKVYDVKLPTLAASTDAAVIARGKHLAESLGGCALSDCHGADLAGGKLLDIGPIGTLQASNITSGGIGAKYSDGELARLLIHGIKRDNTSVTFMPVEDFNWMPDDDVVAVISYLRSVPAVTKETAPPVLGLLGKVLDRAGKFKLDIARHIDHAARLAAPAPAPTAAYGRYVARLCSGCHGDSFAGGPIPGAPPSMPVPMNLTPLETGLKGQTFEDFTKLIATGNRKNGTPLNPFMPIDALRNMNDVERQALWAYLQTLPPKPFGQR